MLVGGGIGAAFTSSGLFTSSFLAYFNFLCCLGVVVGGVMSVWHFTRTQHVAIPPGEGAILGGGSGFVSFVLIMLIEFAVGQSFGAGPESWSPETLQDMDLSPEMRRYAETRTQSSVSTGWFILSTAIAAVLHSVFGAFGGVLGAPLFQNGEGDSETDGPSPDAC